MHAIKLLFFNAVLFATLGFAPSIAQAVTAPFVGLPSCTVVPAQAPSSAPVYIEVDAHGRFYASQFGSILIPSRSYVTTEMLEFLCRQGAKIAFWGSDRFPTLPSPYILVQEFQNGDVLPNFVLSAREEDTLFIFSGKAGPNWRPTTMRLRLPRIASDMVPVHVFFGSDQPGVVTHFYTADQAEYDAMMRKENTPANANVKWVYERVAFYAQRVSVSNGVASCASADTEPVFRISGSSSTNSQPKYRYVANRTTITSMQRTGYEVEAAAFCALVD